MLGLKENIIIGHLIPAGTGMYRYQEVDIDLGGATPEGFEPLPPAGALPGTTEASPFFSGAFGAGAGTGALGAADDFPFPRTGVTNPNE